MFDSQTAAAELALDDPKLLPYLPIGRGGAPVGAQ